MLNKVLYMPTHQSDIMCMLRWMSLESGQSSAMPSWILER